MPSISFEKLPVPLERCDKLFETTTRIGVDRINLVFDPALANLKTVNKFWAIF